MANISEDGDFSKDKLLLDPKKAGIIDLILLLCSPDIKKRNFIDCLEEDRRRDFNRRWLIFVSVVVQKLLIYSRKPLARLGYAFEMWLNLVSSNGGLFLLLVNSIRGTVVRPDRSTVVFRSSANNLDVRVELDGEFKPGHRKYIASLSFMAAKLSYENEARIKSIVQDHWHMELLGDYSFWNGGRALSSIDYYASSLEYASNEFCNETEYQQRASTKAYILQNTKTDPNLVVVAFRGTDTFDADSWCTDVDLSWYEIDNIGKIHRGFMKALGLQKNGWPKEVPQNRDHSYAYYTIREKLREVTYNNRNARIVITGHSLGGALAVLCVAVLAMHDEAELLQKLEGVYTFGQPRVGDGQFGKFMEQKMEEYDVRYSRFVYCHDMVPRLPFDDKTMLYKHFGPCLYYNSCYKGQVLMEEPNKNYFNPLWAIPKYLNAIWELIRSFIIPYTKGPDYRESWFMTLFRVVGLVIPGLSAHLHQDYDNVTRLGSLPESASASR